MISKRSSSSDPKSLSPSPNESSRNKHKKKKPKPSSDQNPNPNPMKEASIPTSPMAPASSPAFKKRKAKESDDNDSLTILEAIIEFQSRNGGANPTPTNMKPLHDSVKDMLHADFTLEQLYNRIRHLRQKYYRQLETGHVGAADTDRAFFDLSTRAWGGSKKRLLPMSNGAGTPKTPKTEIEEEKADGDEEMEDAEDGDGDGDSFRCLSYQAKEYWRAMGLNAEDLDLGFKSLDRAKAKVLEKKWAQHGDAGLKIQAKRCELDRELFLALIAAQKGTN